MEHAVRTPRHRRVPKFVNLGLTADSPVTPPKVIDQVWHEHLLFSRAYREFCATVLLHDFDHHPELVPLDEQTAAFQVQYAATRDLYRTEFNREPPAEFWGTPKFADRPQPAVPAKPLRQRDQGSAVMTGDHAPLWIGGWWRRGWGVAGFHVARRSRTGGWPALGSVISRRSSTSAAGEAGRWQRVLTADEHREVLAAAGFEAIEITTDRRRGWICAVARSQQAPPQGART